MNAIIVHCSHKSYTRFSVTFDRSGKLIGLGASERTLSGNGLLCQSGLGHQAELDVTSTSANPALAHAMHRSSISNCLGITRNSELHNAFCHMVEEGIVS